MSDSSLLALTSRSCRIIHNVDNDEYFDRDAISDDESGLWDDLSLEAVALLLCPEEDDGRTHSRIGSWSGQQVTYARRDGAHGHADITNQVIEMLLACYRTRSRISESLARRSEDS